MAQLPLPLLPFWTAPFTITDAEGFRPNTGGTLTFYEYTEGTPTDLLDTYSDQTGDTVNTNPLIINSAGYPTSTGVEVPIFLQRTGYTVVMKDADGVTLRTLRYVADAASVAQAQASAILATATYVPTLPYVVTDTDEAIYVTATAAGSVFLPATRDRTLVVKNLCGFIITLVPSGAATIENQADYPLPVQFGGNKYPTYQLDLNADATNWQVTSGVVAA